MKPAIRPVPAALRRPGLMMPPVGRQGGGAGACLAGGSEFRRYHCEPVEALHRVLRSFRHPACCSLQQRETPTAEKTASVSPLSPTA